MVRMPRMARWLADYPDPIVFKLMLLGICSPPTCPSSFWKQ